MSAIVASTENFVNNLLKNELDRNFLYHNLKHTQRVVKNTKELLAHYELSADRKECLLLAAWLHDTGYTMGSTNHEESSCNIASRFLTEQNVDPENIASVNKLILATKRFHEPQNLDESIIRDADASHLAKDSYFETSEYLRQELALLGIAHFKKSEWNDINIKMFRSEHNFNTDYAKEHWQSGKEKNLKKLLKTKKKEHAAKHQFQMRTLSKKEFPDREIQTVFRSSLRNHLELSEIADTKANILLSVNAIIISVALANLFPKLDNPKNEYLIYPTFIFLAFAIISMVLAILATRPLVTSKSFSKEDLKMKKVNLLFFGNFYKMKLSDYHEAIDDLLKDRDHIYSTMTKDLYYLGVVLNKKYRLIRWTYIVFIAGIVISALIFGIFLSRYGI